MIKSAKLCIDNLSGGVVSILLTDENEKTLCAPVDSGNTDYQAYLKWLEEGNTPEPADEVPVQAAA
ncbi:hypothetical protein [Polynucleobacter sp. UK-Kesae-W10]|uniref:hypothetical protein n=1 Tax=Polynucleobacter sp. UK-Kesae-W10 TaxID=1819738 RepID=UPI001C0C95CF|nr:hypothetical protein [Polynucleobacter sp. UK-Kesae-W10]MBU3577592.1 hypothetical protein [Polynucleobacter sp. UK-Kesae-W10]